MRNFAVILACVLVTACGDGVRNWPAPLFSSNFPPPGPPNYQQGMMDGCETAQAAIGNAIYGVMHSGVHYDVDAALNDQVYYKAWKDGYFYCKFENHPLLCTVPTNETRA
jgi:hypothetical protein